METLLQMNTLFQTFADKICMDLLMITLITVLWRSCSRNNKNMLKISTKQANHCLPMLSQNITALKMFDPRTKM